MTESLKTPNGRLIEKIAVITGGATGIGRATALMFAEEGAKVSIFDIQDEEGQKTVDMICENGGKAAFFHADVTKDVEINAAFDGAIETFGPYNVLFNHAGTIIVKAMHETSEEEYDWLMDVNVKSAFLTCRRAVQDMSANGGGSIVITSSIAAELGYALESVYCMSKGAVLQLARTISTEYRDAGIRCNAICPGTVESPSLHDRLHATGDYEAAMKAFIARQPMGRIAKAEEIAALVVYLASDESAFTTGQAHIIDGGWSG